MDRLETSAQSRDVRPEGVIVAPSPNEEPGPLPRRGWGLTWLWQLLVAIVGTCLRFYLDDSHRSKTLPFHWADVEFRQSDSTLGR